MTDHQPADPGPQQMAETDLKEAQAKFAEAKTDYAIEAGFNAEANVFASFGLDEVAGEARASAQHEHDAGQRATNEGLAHTFAAQEWSEAGHDLREQSKLTGEAYAAGARAHDAEYSLDRGGLDPDDSRRTQLELEARSEEARQGVFVERAAEMSTEAAEHASRAEHLDREVHMMEDADSQ